MAGVRAAALVAGLSISVASFAQPLPRLHALVDEWTVSGLSSGAYMAVQIAVAHSKQVRGVGVFAGGPYYCVGIDPRRALGICMQGAPDPQAAVREARRLASLNLIDGADHLRRTRAWLMAGERDTTVVEPVVKAAADFLSSFNASGVEYTVQPGLAHGLPTTSAGSACGVSAPPYLNDCGVPAAAQMLAHLLPGAPSHSPATGRLLTYNQAEFVALLRRFWRTSSLDDRGYVYVPQRCEQAVRCRVHVALHGCRQGAGAVGEAFVRDAGYNAWAAAHDLIVLYPQARPSEPSWMAWWLPYNPRGCWDWWGYSGTDYAVRSAVQIAAIVAMVERLGRSR
jgi:poly(3-hydroxybutyrate) depolymerase